MFSKKITSVLLIISALAFFVGCSEDNEKKNPKPQLSDYFGTGIENGSEVLASTLKIVDTDGKAIPTAEVLIGSAFNTPFQGNYLKVSNIGSFVAPKAWTKAETLTISAPGFIRASYLGQLPIAKTFVLRKSEPTDKFELKGEGTGFQTKDLDDYIDFAVMLPAMGLQDLFTFNVNSFISAETDKIKVVGQEVALPSNVALPKQTENYIINIQLAKPQYRMNFSSVGEKSVYTLKGRFPFKKTIREVQNKKAFNELIDNFEMQGGSLKKVSLNGPSTEVNLPVDELVFNQKKSFQAPAIGADDILLAAAVSPYQKFMLPTDIKNAASASNVTLKVPANTSPLLLTVLTKQDEMKAKTGRISASLVPFVAGVAPEHLPLLNAPTVQGTELTWTQPTLNARILDSGMFAVLSTIDKLNNGKTETTTVTRIWEIYADKWADGISIPQWPNDPITPQTKKWEISLLGSIHSNKVEAGPNMFNTVTHATHAQVEFQ